MADDLPAGLVPAPDLPEPAAEPGNVDPAATSEPFGSAVAAVGGGIPDAAEAAEGPAAQAEGEGDEEEEEDYPRQSEDDLRRVLDVAREQGRKMAETKQRPVEDPEEKKEARKKEAARKEKVLARLAQQGAIAFADLFDLGLGKAAAGCTLRVEVLRKVMEHWNNSKQVRVMDHNGDVRSVFFYTDPENPYFDLEEAREGMVFTFQSPNLHYFMDGQTGLRVEDAKAVRLTPNPAWNPIRRLDYGLAEKEDGTRWVKQKKWDEAGIRYHHALDHLSGCPTTDPEVAAKRTEAEKSLYLNLALVLLNKDSNEEVVKMCRKALDIDPTLPKAYFRMGQAQAKERQFEQAEASLLKAQDLEPTDKGIKDALRAVRASMRERSDAEATLWKGKIQAPRDPNAAPKDAGAPPPKAGSAAARPSAGTAAAAGEEDTAPRKRWFLGVGPVILSGVAIGILATAVGAVIMANAPK
jgi:hypothetical protein